MPSAVKNDDIRAFDMRRSVGYIHEWEKDSRLPGRSSVMHPQGNLDMNAG